MGRKHCGKRRNCLLRAISPFPTVFSKGLFPRGVKRWHCVGMGFLFSTQSQLFITLKKRPFEYIVGKKRKSWEPAFSPFPATFSYHLKGNFCFQVTFILSFANDFDLDQSKNCHLVNS